MTGFVSKNVSIRILVAMGVKSEVMTRKVSDILLSCSAEAVHCLPTTAVKSLEKNAPEAASAEPWCGVARKTTPLVAL